MKIISGTFNGTAATLHVGIGFIPDWVKIWNIEDGDGLAVALEWSRNMRSIEQPEGILLDSTNKRTELTYGNGVTIYRGSPAGFSSAQTAYIARDPSPNKVAANTDEDAIDTWTLDTPGSRTGSWADDCNTTYVGEGSRIAIRQNSNDRIYWATVLAMTNEGADDDEVTLDEDIQTGRIEYLQGMYDYLGVKANVEVPEGFVINETSVLNVSGEMCMFEAGSYSNDH